MFEMFKVKAEAVGAEVHRFRTKAEALGFIEDFMKKAGTKDAPGSYAIWPESSILKEFDAQGLADRVPGLKFQITRQLAKDSLIGITQMEWGIANSGTVVKDTTAVEQRLAAALSNIHIALLATNSIVADLATLLSKVDPGKSGYIALTTGPSRTADIERVLAIGVHGPERLVIVCIDDLGGMKS